MQVDSICHSLVICNRSGEIKDKRFEFRRKIQERKFILVLYQTAVDR